MSLHPHVIAPVPEETARVARAAFPKGHPYLTFRDALGTIFQDEDFRAVFPGRGQPGLSPWRLALVTLMQFRETLADRQAAEAVRARIDWKYLLSLELTDPGFDFSVLSEFRDRLLAGSAETLLLDITGCKFSREHTLLSLALVEVQNKGRVWCRQKNVW
jgi:transposase